MLLDGKGNLLFADRGNSRIRKINLTTGIITTVAGTTNGYSGDGGLATNAQISPISFAIDKFDNLIIGDNGANDYIRFVDAATGIISTVAGVGPSGIGDMSEGALATNAYMHPEFLYLDLGGNLFFSNFGGQIRKITNFNPAKPFGVSDCRPVEVEGVGNNKNELPNIYPNPASDELFIQADKATYNSLRLINVMGQTIMEQDIKGSNETRLSLSGVPGGVYMVLLTGKSANYNYKIVVGKN
jgi:hypothetical protein